MSISDVIVVMKEGVIQQVGAPQSVYDDPVNLFVAKFLGTPPINVLNGRIENGKVLIGNEAILDVEGVEDQDIYVGIRPEGLEPNENGALSCKLNNVEIMGRDASVVATHDESLNATIRAIIDSDIRVDTTNPTVKFAVKPHKIFLFSKQTEERILFDAK